MKVYQVKTPFNAGQTSCVVAEDIATAEKLFLKKYPMTKINSIELIADYVIVQGLVKAEGLR